MAATATPTSRIEISSDNRFIDIVAERFDIGVRLGGDVAKDMIAVRMVPDMRLLAVASTDYFARHPPPRTPQELTQHDCICLRMLSHGGLLPWEFERRGKSINAHVTGRLVFNSSDLVLAAALAGLGLAWIPEQAAAEHIATGRLVSVLDDWSRTFPGYHLYYASRSSSPALALVVDALRQTRG